MREFARGVVQERREELGAGGASMAGRVDLISRFLSTEEGAQFTDEELVDVVLNFIIAGRDTTACALSWACLRLLRAPACSAAVSTPRRTPAAAGRAPEQIASLP